MSEKDRGWGWGGCCTLLAEPSALKALSPPPAAALEQGSQELSSSRSVEPKRKKQAGASQINVHSANLFRILFGGIKAHSRGSPGGPVVENPPSNAGDVGLSLLWEDPTCCRAISHNY